jgi:hypothetical protein
LEHLSATIRRGDEAVELRTSDVGQYPELTKILKTLKQVTGVP